MNDDELKEAMKKLEQGYHTEIKLQNTSY